MFEYNENHRWGIGPLRETEMNTYTVWTGARAVYEGPSRLAADAEYTRLTGGGYHARLEMNGVLLVENQYATEDI